MDKVTTSGIVATKEMTIEEYDKLLEPKPKILSWNKKMTASVGNSQAKDFELAMDGVKFLTEVSLTWTSSKGKHRTYYQISIEGTKTQVDDYSIRAEKWSQEFA